MKGRNGILAFAIAMGLFSAGCAATNKVMVSWVGQPSEDLIAKWGPPDSSFQFEDGRRVLGWNTAWKDGGEMHACRQSFMINLDGTIERWTTDGCPRFRRICPNLQDCFPTVEIKR
jgi:hypothetical protein